MAKSPAASASRSPTAARAAGKQAERDVVAYVRAQGGPYAERRLAGAIHDRGDVAGVPGVVLEVKAPGPGSPVALAAWLDETLLERDNDGAQIGVLVIKRRKCGSPGEWFWVTDGETMTRLLREAGWLAA